MTEPTEPLEPFLAIRGLHSSFGGPFDLDIARGECLAIVGKSGSGKSVLLRLIADMDPGLGTVDLVGRSRETWSGPEWRRQVVYQAAEPAWWAPTAGAHFRAGDAAFLAEMLPLLDLSVDLLDADIQRLSTGERQRLALVRSLALDPAVLLLDEPSASLDQASTLAMETVLGERLKAGSAVVMVTHSQEQARRMSHRIFEMIDRVLCPL